jgi:hypothetical protein
MACPQNPALSFSGDIAPAQKHMAHHLLSCEGRVQPENKENFDLRAALGKFL